MGIFAGLLSLFFPEPAPAPAPVVATDATDATSEALARIAGAQTYSELAAVLHSLPGLKGANWLRCESAVKKRMAEIGAM